MCFYNQRQFSCGDWSWADFAERCNPEYRIGETCGLSLINITVNENKKCHFCEMVERKLRWRTNELRRLKGWELDIDTLVASMDPCQKNLGPDVDIDNLQRKRKDLRKNF